MPAPKTQFSEAMGEMMARPVFEIAAFEVVGAPRRMAIPDRLPIPSREYPLISDSEIVARRTVTFSMKTGSKRIIAFRAQFTTTFDTNFRSATKMTVSRSRTSHIRCGMAGKAEWRGSRAARASADRPDVEAGRRAVVSRDCDRNRDVSDHPARIAQAAAHFGVGSAAGKARPAIA
jgi:hypothetical protein